MKTMKTKTENQHHSRSVNLGKAVSLDGHDGTPKGSKKLHELRKQCVAPTPESAEERFAEATAGLDAETVADLKKLSGFYANVCVLEHLGVFVDVALDASIAQTLRQVLRNVCGARTEIAGVWFLRDSLRWVFNLTHGEQHALFLACREYAEPQAREKLRCVCERIQHLSGSLSGLVLMRALGLEQDGTLQAAARRVGASAPVIVQRANRLQRRASIRVGKR
jgi:hypothetical protein